MTITANFGRTYTVSFTKNVTTATFIPSNNLSVQENPVLFNYFHNVVQIGPLPPSATWGGTGLTDNQSSYTLTGSQKFYINYSVPKTTPDASGYGAYYHSINVFINSSKVLTKNSNTSSVQTGTLNFTTNSTATVVINCRTSLGGIIAFRDNNIKEKLYVDKKEHLYIIKRFNN